MFYVNFFFTVSWFHLTDKTIVFKNLKSMHGTSLVEKYCSEEGYKKISKTINVLWNTAKTIIE